MGDNESSAIGRGQWMALAAALLGWMFDGLEMGLFPLVAGPALNDLLHNPERGAVSFWLNIATASFLVGAATGGVLFGWLGDRLGRVRAMTLSVLTYAIFSGLCGVAQSPAQITVLRFLSALGMGGEWSLGVALVMEIWPDRSRAFLAGLIGAAANVGYLLIALLGFVLGSLIGETASLLQGLGLPDNWVAALVANGGWRLLMMAGALPALLTFFIRLFVPESARWQEERKRGATSHWATRDLLGVLVGAAGGIAIIVLWAVPNLPLVLRILGSVPALVVATLGYLFPVARYVARIKDTEDGAELDWGRTLRRLLLGAALGGVALLGTWASIQQVPTWAYEMTKTLGPDFVHAKSYTQICSAFGAIIGTIVAALLGGWLGRRITYCGLCLASLGSALLLFQLSGGYGSLFLFFTFLAGAMTASFYGWLPLYLPELFPTKVRATGQGFSFNFGRIIAAIGALQGGYLIVEVFKNDFATVCSILSLVYLVGMGIIWLAPETQGQPLPE
jgi:MFS transporter, SHS family, sialic acid transporter